MQHRNKITCLAKVDRKDYKSISTQMMQPKTKITDVESNPMIQLSPFYMAQNSALTQKNYNSDMIKVQIIYSKYTTIDFCKNNIQSQAEPNKFRHKILVSHKHQETY